MEERNRKALIVGATGLVGGFLVNELLISSLYDEIHVLSRRPLGLSGDKLRETIVDFDNLEGAANAAATSAPGRHVYFFDDIVRRVGPCVA